MAGTRAAGWHGGWSSKNSQRQPRAQDRGSKLGMAKALKPQSPPPGMHSHHQGHPPIQTAPPTGHHVFKHRNLWGAVSFKPHHLHFTNEVANSQQISLPPNITPMWQQSPDTSQRSCPHHRNQIGLCHCLPDRCAISLPSGQSSALNRLPSPVSGDSKPIGKLTNITSQLVEFPYLLASSTLSWRNVD